jgi:hypothetical protein
MTIAFPFLTSASVIAALHESWLAAITAATASAAVDPEGGFSR